MKALGILGCYLMPLLYLGITYFYYTVFLGTNKRLAKRSTWLLTGLIAIHLLHLGLFHFSINRMLFSSVYDFLSFLSFSIVLVYLIIELRLNNKASGFFILSFAFIVELISLIYLNPGVSPNPLLKNPGFVLHVSMTIIGYTALALSAIYALMYILQERSIKKHRFGVIFQQLPALKYLEKMSIQAVVIGIIFLGFGIIHGHVQANKVLGTFWLPDIKVIMLDALWLIYVLGYFLSKILRWYGRRMAWLSLLAFLILLVGGMVVSNISTSFHHFF